MKRSTAFFLAIVTMLILLGLYIAAVKIGPGGNNGGSSFEASAQQAVEAQGYKNVQYIGVDTFACGEVAGVAFDADNVNGVRVRLVACNPDGLINFNKGWHIVTR